MPSVFLCHSSADKPFVRSLARRLSDVSISVWVDEAELKAGDSLIGCIGAALDAVDYVCVILSAASIGSSWVQRELATALTREFALRRVVVVPILLERVDLPPFLRDKVYADFSTHSDHDAAFARLAATLRGLSVSDAKKLDATPLNLDDSFQTDLRATLETIRSERLQLFPFIPDRILRNASTACSFTAHRELVCVLDFDRRWFWRAGKSAAIFARRGLYVGGKDYNSSGPSSVFISYEDLNEADFQIHSHEEHIDRGTHLRWSSLSVRDIHLDAPGGWEVLDVLLRSVKLTRLLVKRYHSNSKAVSL